jgi:hypothetical protein
MDAFIEMVYVRELRGQCESAAAAVRRMNELLRERQSLEFFREAADFLQHAACISRLLWPAPKGSAAERARATARGNHLCCSLGVDSTHVLRGRDLRDHLEHYDERIDDWAETSPNRNIVDNMIGPRTAIGGTAIKDSDIMRLFDPATKQFIFRGESFDIQALVSGVEDIKVKAAKRSAAIDPWGQRTAAAPAR